MPATQLTIAQKLNKEISSVIKRLKNVHRSTGGVTYTEFLSDKMLMMAVIRNGVSYPLFHLIQHVTPFSDADWAHFLNLSTKSLQRYKQTARPFKPIQSEKIIELAEATQAGLDVFGSMEKFKLWLNTPNFALGNSKPIELLSDSYGKELVLGELTRINHGILA